MGSFCVAGPLVSGNHCLSLRFWWWCNICPWINSRGCRTGEGKTNKQKKLNFISFQAQQSLYIPTHLTFRNSTFCPQGIFICFHTDLREKKNFL